MHGRLKVRTSAEEAARKKKEQELKVKAYRAGMTKILSKRHDNELDDEMLNLTGQILSRNPDVYTLWNIRKECILKMQEDKEVADVQGIYDKDLNFTEQCLMVNPKSYGGWHHRCWILENCPEPNWEKELSLCNKYLKLDERNFHCWDYRRFVVTHANVPSEKELEYCTEKIRHNFSNYSSWHYRSKLLPLLFPHESNPIRPISEAKLKEELEMVLTAAFTDPNDSSAWFYQRWLLGYSQPALDIAAFRIKDDFAVISFTKAVNNKNFKLSSNLDIDLNVSDWKPLGGNFSDSIWISQSKFNLPKSEEKFLLNCKFDDNEEYSLTLTKCSDGFFGVNTPKFEYEFGAAVLEELKNQLNSCNQLLEYEPDSKWTLLTAALLMRAINRNEYHTKSLEYLKKLEIIDSLRKGYYQDLATKWQIEQKLEEWMLHIDFKCLKLDLSDLQLTTLFYEQYMSIFDEIDLSKNLLFKRSAPKLNAFQFCNKLVITDTLFSGMETVTQLNLKNLIVGETPIPLTKSVHMDK